jgi:hypothetical protein
VLLDRWIRHGDKGGLYFGAGMLLDREKALVHVPDLAFVATPRKRRFKSGWLFGVADLCVQIVKGPQPDFIACRRFADYQRYGVPWFWSWYIDRSPTLLEECQLVNGRYQCRTEIVGAEWFEPGLFPGLVFRLPQLLEGDLKGAVKGKAKKLI